MDFLDPRKKRAHSIRLMIGYVLMAVAIGLATIILVYAAYGYGINTKTGQITGNGLLFVDSKPGGAAITLNGDTHSGTTAARLILPAGLYDLSLKKDGYREWTRKFILDEHSISRYVYPFLFPETLNPAAVKTYPAAPALITQTPDRRWILVQLPSVAREVRFDVYDTDNPLEPPEPITLPTTLLSGYDPAVSLLKEVEWSTDNNNLLLEHTFKGGREFVIVNRRNPEQSVNINRLFNTAPSRVTLRDKKPDQLYMYDSAAKTIRVARTNSRVVEQPLLSGVEAFKTYGDDLMIYVSARGAPADSVRAYIWDDGESYPLSTFASGSKYLIDVARFQDHWYYVAGGDTSGRINIYKDPLDSIKNPRDGTAAPIIGFHVEGVNTMSFSANARFVGVQAKQRFGVYDLETKTRYQYDLASPITQPLEWMDGHRFMGRSGNSILVMDYDGINRQRLTPTALAEGGYFSRDYNGLYTIIKAADGSGFSLQRTDMRTGDDLPEELR